MSDFVETVGLERTLTDLGVAWKGRNFEDIYDELYQANPDSDMLRTLEASTAATSARDRLALWARVKSRRRERLHSMRPFEAR